MIKDNMPLLKAIVMTSAENNAAGTKVPYAAGYLGVIAEKNGTLQHIFVLLSKPVCSLSEEEENRVYEYCESILPEIAEIRAQEIAPEYVNGTMTNAEAWQKAPRLGLFPAEAAEDVFLLFTKREEAGK